MCASSRRSWRFCGPDGRSTVNQLLGTNLDLTMTSGNGPRSVGADAAEAPATPDDAAARADAAPAPTAHSATDSRTQSAPSSRCYAAVPAVDSRQSCASPGRVGGGVRSLAASAWARYANVDPSTSGARGLCGPVRCRAAGTKCSRCSGGMRVVAAMRGAPRRHDRDINTAVCSVATEATVDPADAHSVELPSEELGLVVIVR